MQRPRRTPGARARQVDRFGPITLTPLTPATMATPPTTSDPGRSRGPVSSEPSTLLPLVHIGGSDLCAVRTEVTNLSDDQVKDKVDHPLGNTPPKTSTAHELRYSLPNEIVEMIIAHLTRDLGALKACSLTCRSLYIAAVPHLHHTLTLWTGARDKNRRELKPLSKLNGLGLAPLIREIRMLLYKEFFVPQAFSPDDLRHFSAFTNVQTLILRTLDINRFILCVERYFGHFSPTLRSIKLAAPYCTPRQLSYFLSLFPNLDDVNISSTRKLFSTVIPGKELALFSAPKLRGRLELYGTDWVETWTDLITSCGGLRFHYMDLRWVGGCAPFLLGACAGTLETLGCSLCKWLNTGLSVDLG